MVIKREIPQWKKDAVVNLAELMGKYKVFGLIDLSNMPDNIMQLMRRKLRDKVVFRMAKKSLFTRALEIYQKKSKKKNLIEFGDYIRGQTSIIFTNMDPFELKEFFDINKMKTFAKENDIAQEDIVVPAGDTLLPPGQVISELNLTLKLPTRIQNDSIWVTEDTITHEKGDVISLKESVALRKLNIKPIELRVKFYCAWDEGEIVPESILSLDVEEIQQEISLAALHGQKLAIELGIIDEDTIVPIINNAIRAAFNVALEMPFFIDNIVEYYLNKAISNANAVYNQILGEAPSEKMGDKEVKKEKPKESEKPRKPKDDEEEGLPGLGSLFNS
jgi:large subunit ribosomal protein L10